MELKKIGIFLWPPGSIILILLLLICTASYSQSPLLATQADTAKVSIIDGSDSTFSHEEAYELPVDALTLEAKLNVFPNPAHGNVQVTFEEECYDDFHTLTLLVYDIYGKTCIRQIHSAKSNKFKIDIVNLRSGTYFIIIHDEWGRFMSEKLIVR